MPLIFAALSPVLEGCATVKVQVFKHIVNMTGAEMDPGEPFTITTNCTPASSPAAFSLTDGPFGYKIVSVPPGASCSPTEELALGPSWIGSPCSASGGTAYWEPPVFLPGPSHGTGGMPVLDVFNVRRCGVPDSTGTLTIARMVVAQQGVLPTAPNVDIILTCDGVPQQLSLGPVPFGPGVQTFVKQEGTNCTVSEPPQPHFFLGSFCFSGGLGGGILKDGNAHWVTPTTYLPQQSATLGVTIAAGQATVIKVIDTFACD